MSRTNDCKRQDASPWIFNALLDHTRALYLPSRPAPESHTLRGETKSARVAHLELKAMDIQGADRSRES
jgi:hypothetical protein